MLDTIRIRAIRPDDRERHLEFFRGLGAGTVSFRFLSARKDLSETELTYFTEVDFERHVALVATVGEGDEEKTVGVGRFVILNEGDRLTDRAEVAITVADELQGKGVGKRLLQELIPLARSRGVRLFDLTVSASNTRALAMVHHNLRVISTQPEAGTLRIMCAIEGDFDIDAKT